MISFPYPTRVDFNYIEVRMPRCFPISASAHATGPVYTPGRSFRVYSLPVTRACKHAWKAISLRALFPGPNLRSGGEGSELANESTLWRERAEDKSVTHSARMQQLVFTHSFESTPAGWLATAPWKVEKGCDCDLWVMRESARPRAGRLSAALKKSLRS